MHFMGKLGLEKVSKRSRKGLEKVSKRSRKGLGETLTMKKTFFNLRFKCQQNNNVSVFNVQIIRLYSLGSWNFYVPDNFKSTEVSEWSRLQHCSNIVVCVIYI